MADVSIAVGTKAMTIRGTADDFHKLIEGCVEILEGDLRMTNVILPADVGDVPFAITLIRNEFLVKAHPLLDRSKRKDKRKPRKKKR